MHIPSSNEMWIFLLTAVLGLFPRFYWSKGSGGQSNVTIQWHIPAGTEPGVYRLRYFGHYKKRMGLFRLVTVPFEGSSAGFQITAP